MRRRKSRTVKQQERREVSERLGEEERKTYFGLEGEECKTNKDAKRDEQCLNNLSMGGRRLVGQGEGGKLSTHNSALIIAHSQSDHCRFKQSEQTQQD